jgi:hypothetical protein
MSGLWKCLLPVEPSPSSARCSSRALRPREAIAKEFGVTRFAEVHRHPRWNVAPSGPSRPSSPWFRRAFRRHRFLVIADGF